MVDGDDMGLVADPALGHGLGESLGRCDLGGNRVVEIDDVTGPVDVDRAGDVRRPGTRPCAPVVGVFDARFERTGDHIAAHVDDAEVRLSSRCESSQSVETRKIVRLRHGDVPGGFLGESSH